MGTTIAIILLIVSIGGIVVVLSRGSKRRVTEKTSTDTIQVKPLSVSKVHSRSASKKKSFVTNILFQMQHLVRIMSSGAKKLGTSLGPAFTSIANGLRSFMKKAAESSAGTSEKVAQSVQTRIKEREKIAQVKGHLTDNEGKEKFFAQLLSHKEGDEKKPKKSLRRAKSETKKKFRKEKPQVVDFSPEPIEAVVPEVVEEPQIQEFPQPVVEETKAKSVPEPIVAPEPVQVQEQVVEVEKDNDTHLQQVTWERLEEKWIRVISQDPKNIEAYKKLARIYFDQKKWEESSQTAQAARQLGSQDIALDSMIEEAESHS